MEISKSNFLELNHKHTAEREQQCFTIHWKLTEWCNYRCEYCFQRDNDRTWRDYATVCSAADKINAFIDKINKPTKLFLIGGEVTYYDLIDLLEKHLTSRNIFKINLTTNLSKDLEFFQNLKNYCLSRNIELMLTASMHLSQIKNIDEFIDKCVSLNCGINSVLGNDNAVNLLSVLQKLVDRNYDLSRVDILFDQNEQGNRSDTCLQTYRYWLDQLKEYNGNAYRVKLVDGSERLVSRAELKTNISDFIGIKCKGYLRVMHNNKVKTGACGSHNTKLTIDDLAKINNEFELDKLLTVTCNTANCPICVFQKMWKE